MKRWKKRMQDKGPNSIIDHGIGLTREQQAWIFDLFAQVDTTLERASSQGGGGVAIRARTLAAFPEPVVLLLHHPHHE